MTGPHRLSVSGMDCGRCERAAVAGLKAVPGVAKVSAHAPTGRITLTCDSAMDDGALREALARAGFTVLRRV
ncbi:heavy-metal-associated domain-containing protein [Kitasatospora sp. NPDC090091]|uniref:heavy-metal-associated domain-containing protein n=1 Tax=Kitasatospora sp. NPDC090091 TaxID=3364081 RepID=UPI0037F4F4F5